MNIRLADGSDFPVLERMLLEAVNWAPDRPRLTIEELRQNDMLTRYLDEWPGVDDAGVVAEEDDRVIGAAWFRRFASDRPGFGFIDESIPEVSIAVTPNWRGRGVGSGLMVALADIGRQRGFEALSLSVESHNRAVRFYQRLGFKVAVKASGSYTMGLDL